MPLRVTSSEGDLACFAAAAAQRGHHRAAFRVKSSSQLNREMQRKRKKGANEAKVPGT